MICNRCDQWPIKHCYVLLKPVNDRSSCAGRGVLEFSLKNMFEVGRLKLREPGRVAIRRVDPQGHQCWDVDVLTLEAQGRAQQLAV